MSASQSPVVTPRKGKHTRSRGTALSQSALSGHDSPSRFGTGQAAFPLGVDPLTLDPDEAFTRMSVRDIQALEASLESSHDALSSKLRSLVSERYRDMLGTANTLIEMSSSATNLVKRLDAVRVGIESAGEVAELGDQSIVLLSGEHANLKKEHEANEDNAGTTVFHYAAATKLLAESPDDVWTAIDSASVSSVASGKKALLGRELSNYKAATALRAAWIYILCQEAWRFLSLGNGMATSKDEVNAEGLFPYISKQWHTLSPMRVGIVNLARSGLAGWYSIEGSSNAGWEDVSSSYMATVTFLLTIAFLEETSLTSLRDQLLQSRRRAIEDQLWREKKAPSTTLARLIRCMTDTLLHSLRAFAITDMNSGLPHLASIFADVSKSNRRIEGCKVPYPPLANQVLSTLPSSAIFVEHLPEEVRQFAPTLALADAEECQQSTLKALEDWCRSIREQGQQRDFLDTINILDTIASIGEAQSQLWESLDQCLALVERACKGQPTAFQDLIEGELKRLVESLDALLLQRLDNLCNEQAAELPKVVSICTTSALEVLKGGERKTEAERHARLLEETPINFFFEGDLSYADCATVLRLHTPLVEGVISSLEEKAASLMEELEAYTSYVERGAQRRQRRMQKRNREEDGRAIMKRQEEKTKEVLDSYQKAFDSARMALVEGLKSKLEGLGVEAASRDGTRYLLLGRIISALSHSETLQSKVATSVSNASDLFHQDMTTLRKQVNDHWVAHVVKDAVARYHSRREDFFNTALEEQDRPSSALVESLLRLVDGIHAVGCSYNSELTSLGLQFIHSFVDAWTDSLQAKDKSLHTFDAQVLLVLLKHSRESQEGDSRLARLEGISGGAQPVDQGQIEAALSRLRLALHPLSPLYLSSLSPLYNQNTANSMASLPNLSAIKGT
ncbi:hypothetical protein CBS101457_001576 [Exobasidium rhododendri]|nr:hypothetical protein CBS101457_001576 [Exobasidium rhododendri]